MNTNAPRPSRADTREAQLERRRRHAEQTVETARRVLAAACGQPTAVISVDLLADLIWHARYPWRTR